MNHCLVTYETGSGEFAATGHCVVSTDGEIWPAIQKVFSDNWGEETIQHEGDIYRWFNRDEDQYIKIGNMAMIDEAEAHVLSKHLNSHKIESDPTILCIHDTSPEAIAAFLNTNRNQCSKTVFHYYPVSSERYNTTGLLASSMILSAASAKEYYERVLAADYANAGVEDKEI